ncbi:hypothetical protein [Hymenobacter siberiensis]|uniref:hypothetical protein n=1 Tax=Hymenobacter siberiensis TaxID=2848396 RepID=UPI001C1E797F|nr:hypothetical protein [Hymenobacter siberiensis]
MGHYHDPRLGIITARSFVWVGQRAACAPTTDEVFDSLVLVLKPDAADDAALFRSQVSTAGAALSLYTHLPLDPLTAIVKDFALAAGAEHFYQVATDGTGTPLTPLTTSLQALDVSRAAQESYIDGALGL